MRNSLLWEGISSLPQWFSGKICEKEMTIYEMYVRTSGILCTAFFADGTCNEECNNENCFLIVSIVLYDGIDCSRNILLRNLTNSSTTGIVFKGPPLNVLDKTYSTSCKTCIVHLALDSNNKAWIYEWSFENGVGKEINLGELGSV
ncbi:unnamed protein product [Brugia pahangi]|uniref:LNR domain-containing protein n=1 Tax=Brugia pahangi TaxID=6280 RepID=A0A0N4T275_BRUPA|nr:unnamed protein product [Brugia pahangi]